MIILWFAGLSILSWLVGSYIGLAVFLFTWAAGILGWYARDLLLHFEQGREEQRREKERPAEERRAA